MTSPFFHRASRAEVTRLWMDRTIPVAEICKRTNLTLFALAHRVNAYGLPKRQGGPTQTITDTDTFTAMWTAGVLSKSMALNFGVSERTIRNTRAALGLHDRAKSARPRLTLQQYMTMQAIKGMARDAAAEQAQMLVAEMADQIGAKFVGWDKARVG